MEYNKVFIWGQLSQCFYLNWNDKIEMKFQNIVYSLVSSFAGTAIRKYCRVNALNNKKKKKIIVWFLGRKWIRIKVLLSVISWEQRLISCKWLPSFLSLHCLSSFGLLLNFFLDIRKQPE